MNETTVTLVGNAATAVEHRQTVTGVPVARFRLATTTRRWDKERGWTDGETSFYTVRAWRSLADNVAASVAVGEPLVVRGRLRVREGEQPQERGGKRWFSADVDADAIGHDLARGTAAFRRVSRVRTEPVPQHRPPTARGADTTAGLPTGRGEDGAGHDGGEGSGGGSGGGRAKAGSAVQTVAVATGPSATEDIEGEREGAAARR
ncbi:single-stranded DNA-binding protein [Streptomyces sp. NPDC003077]|uniref:single-stranded DNA-binding protein n=1 Tax=Streptomyces sp. NPDC003077 TaxID=3154443 RepID=UPI0033B4042E